MGVSFPSSSVETIRWNKDCLELIDQRILPQHLEYVQCRSAAETAAAIRDLVVRGAPAIGCTAAYGIAVESLRLCRDAKTFAAGIEKAYSVLAASRPTAVNLFRELARMRDCMERVKDKPPIEIAACLLDKAHAILDEDIRVNQTLGDYGAALLHDGQRVLTHCNAGALATAGYGTALGVIRSAVRQGKKVSVIADETRPFLQGARLTAWELAKDNIPVTLITDNMAGHMMQAGEIDAVVVGTDRVAANGDVANKIGTYMVAVLARRHNIPFYVACPTSTIDMTLDSGIRIPVEERDKDEVLGFAGMPGIPDMPGIQWAPDGIAVRNPAFDVTPAELVDAIITERGVIHKPNHERISALSDDT